MPSNPLANMFGFNPLSMIKAPNNQQFNRNQRPQQTNNTPVNNTTNRGIENSEQSIEKEEIREQRASSNPSASPLGPFAQLFGSNLGAFNKFKTFFSKDNAQDSSKPLQGFFDGLLKDFNIDEEKIILGVLIYLLYKNGSDVKLLLALGYLLI